MIRVGRSPDIANHLCLGIRRNPRRERGANNSGENPSDADPCGDGNPFQSPHRGCLSRGFEMIAIMSVIMFSEM